MENTLTELNSVAVYEQYVKSGKKYVFAGWYHLPEGLTDADLTKRGNFRYFVDVGQETRVNVENFVIREY